MAWRNAKSLKVLLDQVNAAYPHRRKNSDGTIGDEAHATRNSDHNPYIKVKGVGVVRALDLTHAPETGFDAYAFAEMLLKNKDPRVRYVISNRKIASGKDGPEPWKWRPYKCPPNKNPHDHHTHVSVTENPAEFDSAMKWNLNGLEAEVEAQAPVANNYVAPPTTLREGSRGDLVKKMQAGIGATVDGFFGPLTKNKLKEFQRAKGLTADGVCGPATWDVLI